MDYNELYELMQILEEEDGDFCEPFDEDEDFDIFDIDEEENVETEGEEDAEDERLGHRDRLRSRLSRYGMEEYSPVQMLELLLCYVMPRQDVKKVSDALLNHYGDLRNLFRADIGDFRRFPGLGETGARWLEKICVLVRAFSRLRDDDGVKIVNLRQLRAAAREFLERFGLPCSLHIVTDGADNLMFIRLLCRDNQWGRTRCIARAVEDAARMHAVNSYLLVMDDDPAAHPTAYDQKSLRDYCLLLQHANCTLREVLFMNRSECISLSRMGAIPNMAPYIHHSIAEDDKEAPLVLDELILHSYPETDPFQ